MRILCLQARHGIASLDTCCRASPLASLDSRLVKLEGVSVLETLGDIPNSWIVSLVHLERNATKFSPRQFNMARYESCNHCNFVVTLAYQLPSQIDVTAKPSGMRSRAL